MRTYEVVDFAVGSVERKVSAGHTLCEDLILDTLMRLRELK